MTRKTKVDVPKRILGFKLSKGTRKDLRKLLTMVERPETRTVALTAGTGLATFLAERFAERKLSPQDGRRDKAGQAPGEAH